MRAYLHYDRAQEHQLKAMAALARGLATHGVHVDLSDGGFDGGKADFVAWWGDKVPLHLKGKPRLILEAGYINGRSGDYVTDRLQYVSVGWNGLHGRADPGPPDCPPDRWEATGVHLQAWHGNTSTIVLICDQHPGDSCSPGDRKWWREIDRQAQEAGLRVVYRPHPLLADNGMLTLRESLELVTACVTWSSTAAVESVICGVPTVALDHGSMAWDVTTRNLANKYLGARSQWAYNLAYRQWTHDELASGEAWDHIQEGIPQ
jgi:hypothetical protein